MTKEMQSNDESFHIAHNNLQVTYPLLSSNRLLQVSRQPTNQYDSRVGSEPIHPNFTRTNKQ